MKRKILRYLVVLMSLTFALTDLSAQVEWRAPQVREIAPEIYRIELTATIDEGWKMYDMGSYDNGVTSTSLSFRLPKGVTFDGGVRTLQPSTRKYDAMFAEEIGAYHDSVTFVQDLHVERSGSVEVTVEWMLCSATSCMPPTDASFVVDVGTTQSSMWLVILEAILWGFAALLTPCVFPMVPMTMSFFMKDNRHGRAAAALYGLFIIALYTIPIALLIAASLLFGGDAVTADIFNWIATHWLPNILFFIIFMLFAASFFGAFEISLPSRWVNSSDSRADRGSVGGIFFLALTLVLVSFSCTGVIVGSVLIKSTSGEVWQPIITMLAFSSAFALPFVAVALFPSLMQKMPRSGGWLSSVKIVLGFLEIALGLKFLSVADQVYGWGILPRWLYLAIWIATFSLLALYLVGAIRFPHESKGQKIGALRLSLAAVVVAFVAYITPGLWGAPLTHLAGYLPPPTYAAAPQMQSIDEALERANQLGKPLLVDFTGYGCVNCREMEQRVWSDPEVAQLLDKYLILPLYMDDKKELPKSQWITTPSGRILKSAGRVNSHLALSRFGVNAQPYYIILGRNGKELTPPRGYDLDIKAYIEFLDAGLRAY